MNTRVSEINLIKLKIKVKSLAEEAKIIRKEELRFRGTSYEQGMLTDHRRWDVRNECRATQLAIAFLKGKPYETVEVNRREEFKLRYVVAKRVNRIVRKYSTPSFERGLNGKDVLEWLKLD